MRDVDSSEKPKSKPENLEDQKKWWEDPKFSFSPGKVEEFQHMEESFNNLSPNVQNEIRVIAEHLESNSMDFSDKETGHVDIEKMKTMNSYLASKEDGTLHKSIEELIEYMRYKNRTLKKLNSLSAEN